MICPNCQAENGAGIKFCIECGSPLALRCPGEAISVLQALGARPALERAQALRAAMPTADEEVLTPSGTSAAPPAS